MHKRTILSAVLLSAAACRASGPISRAPAASSLDVYPIAGIATDSAASLTAVVRDVDAPLRAIEGVQVRLTALDRADHPVIGFHSDSVGHGRFAVVQPGRYRLQTRRIGYADHAFEITVPAQCPMIAEIYLRARPAALFASPRPTPARVVVTTCRLGAA